MTLFLGFRSFITKKVRPSRRGRQMSRMLFFATYDRRYASLPPPSSFPLPSHPLSLIAGPNRYIPITIPRKIPFPFLSNVSAFASKCPSHFSFTTLWLACPAKLSFVKLVCPFPKRYVMGVCIYLFIHYPCIPVFALVRITERNGINKIPNGLENNIPLILLYPFFRSIFQRSIVETFYIVVGYLNWRIEIKSIL